MTTGEELNGQGPGDIRELLARIKNGDEEAARELLSRYESKVRLVVRRQLPRLLRSRFDSIDFLQSVWGSFFHRIQTGPNDLNEEENLIAFLAWAARNKVIDEYRRAATQKQNIHREESIENRERPGNDTGIGRHAKRAGSGPRDVRPAQPFAAGGPAGDPGAEGGWLLLQRDRRAGWA